MNLLIGVLGQNFELYQDQSALLFQRARAKMLLEIKARPWRRIGSGFIKMIRQIWLSEFRYGFLFLWLGASILLMVFLPFLITLGTCVIFIAVTCRIVFQIQLSGIYYSTAVALGYYGPQANAKADESWIWVLVRPERPLEDMRSLRTELRSQLENLRLETLPLLAGRSLDSIYRYIYIHIETLFCFCTTNTKYRLDCLFFFYIAILIESRIVPQPPTVVFLSFT